MLESPSGLSVECSIQIPAFLMQNTEGLALEAASKQTVVSARTPEIRTGDASLLSICQPNIQLVAFCFVTTAMKDGVRCATMVFECGARMSDSFGCNLVYLKMS